MKSFFNIPTEQPTDEIKAEIEHSDLVNKETEVTPVTSEQQSDKLSCGSEFDENVKIKSI